MSYVDIVKTYSPPVVNGLLTVFTYDMPIQWVIRIENGKSVNAYRIGQDESIKLNECETWITIKATTQAFSFTLKASNTDGVNDTIERTTYDAIEVKMRVPKGSSVESIWNVKSFESKHDRVINLAGQKFYVQADYLSIWSNYFDRMFNSDFAEKNQQEIIIEGVEPADFEELLMVIYPTRKEVNEKNVVAVWKLADRFDVPSVAKLCEDFLTTVPGFYLVPLMDKLVLAQIVTSEKLQNKCSEVIKKFPKDCFDCFVK